MNPDPAIPHAKALGPQRKAFFSMKPPRLGCVSYLNSRPLCYGIETELATPAALAENFLAGHYDAALIPLYVTLGLPRPIIADGFGIVADGPIQSVVVAHRGPLEETPEIVLDPASRTSSNLLRVLVAKCLRYPGRLVEKSSDPQAARLVIGDPALEFQKSKGPGWHAFDLGRAWREWTGLPFVFAAWALSESAPAGTADFLRTAARDGLAARQKIAANEPDPAAALDYITNVIHYPIGDREKAGIDKFRELLIECDLLPKGAPEPAFV